MSTAAGNPESGGQLPPAGFGHESFSAGIEMVPGDVAEESANTLEVFLKKTHENDVTQDVMKVVSR